MSGKLLGCGWGGIEGGSDFPHSLKLPHTRHTHTPHSLTLLTLSHSSLSHTLTLSHSSLSHTPLPEPKLWGLRPGDAWKPMLWNLLQRGAYELQCECKGCAALPLTTCTPLCVPRRVCELQNVRTPLAQLISPNRSSREHSATFEQGSLCEGIVGAACVSLSKDWRTRSTAHTPGIPLTLPLYVMWSIYKCCTVLPCYF